MTDWNFIVKGRGQGKTYDLMQLVENFVEKHPDQTALIVTHSMNESVRLKTLLTEAARKRTDIVCSNIVKGFALRGRRYKGVFIDNVEYMTPKTFQDEILPMRPDTFGMTSNHLTEIIHLFNVQAKLRKMSLWQHLKEWWHMRKVD